MPVWSVPASWPGETVFILGGGPSVRTEDLELLRGRRVIAINSSYKRLAEFGLPPPHVPQIDYLLVGDNRWWRQYAEEARRLPFPIVTMAQKEIRDDDERVLKLRKDRPPGLSLLPTALTMRRTTFSAAINMAVLMAPGGNIVLLGADGQFAADGERNHHGPMPWKHKPGCWELHYRELKTLVGPLRDLGVKVINASPGSAWDLWPVMSLPEAIEATS